MLSLKIYTRLTQQSAQSFRSGAPGLFDIWRPWLETGASLSARAILTVVGVPCSTFLSNHFCYQWYISPTQKNNRELLIRDVVNMPRNNARVDPCFKKAVENILKHPTLTVPDAMKLADFSPQEQACRAKRMIVYRSWERPRRVKPVRWQIKYA